MIDLQARIREQRKHHRLSLEDISKEIGITKQSLSMIERKRNQPSFKVGIKLCSLFGIDPTHVDLEKLENTSINEP